MKQFEITVFTMTDYEEVMELWRDLDGIGLSSADEPDRIRAYLERNPKTSLVARLDNEVVGAVLAGHDGRRGFLHHLAVAGPAQGQGLGRRLVEAALAALSQEGITKCHAMVFVNNDDGLEFWKRVGWFYREDLGLVSRFIS